MQEYFQPKIGAKIRVFSLGRKNNILTKKRVYQERPGLIPLSTEILAAVTGIFSIINKAKGDLSEVQAVTTGFSFCLSIYENTLSST